MDYQAASGPGSCLPALRICQDDIELAFEFVPGTVAPDPPGSPDSPDGADAEAVRSGLARVEQAFEQNLAALDALERDIDRLTSHADRTDVLVAVGSGVLAGLVDAFWVGEFDFRGGKAWSNRKVNEFVMATARKHGYKGERLDGAIRFLEKSFPLPSDNVWHGKGVGISARSHHLDDLAHHPTPLGLFFSILTQFTETAYFQNSEGTFLPIGLDEAGRKLVGTDIPSKIFCGTVNWFFHLVSDMSGSNKTAGVGMGIPGPIVSLLKELSLIPGLDATSLPKKIRDVFVGERFDLRAELAVAHELGRQAFPVLINEVLVRAFFFLRRLVAEVRQARSLADIRWRETLPTGNRTIARMLTIATGTFTAVDLADAAIHAGLKSGGVNGAAFATQLLLRVNFVGGARFAVAVYTDASMGHRLGRARDERIALLGQQLHLAGASVAYRQADAWLSAKQAEATLQQAEQMMLEAVRLAATARRENRDSLRRISEACSDIETRNPGLLASIQRTLLEP